ncbi:MAG TPA: hypothetical protein VGO67_13905 [Verrucomicrobiae bacterium]
MRIGKAEARICHRLIRAAIRKVRPGKRGTYTVRYFTRDTEIVALF